MSPGTGPADGVTPAHVLDFWFGSPPLQQREQWFRKSAAFDEQVRAAFGPLVEQALAGTLPPEWHDTADGRLAQLILLDQFTRNLFRGHARAFAGDPQAMALARAMMARGEDLALHPLQRWFVYLPLEHAEDLAAQDECVERFAALAAEAHVGTDLAASLDSALDYAQRHRDVIQRFGRFPHRNAALQRPSTAEEHAWLQLPGSGF